MGVRNLRTDYGRGKGEEGEYSWIAGAPQSEELLKTLEELDLEGERDDELDLCLFHVWRGEGLQSELQTPGLALDPQLGPCTVLLILKVMHGTLFGAYFCKKRLVVRW